MMKRYKESELDQLAEILKKDGVISVPTDTVYGVCARMNSQRAKENLVKVKNRPETKPFPVMCANEEQIKQIAIVGKREEKLIREFMPGPITLILKKIPGLPEYINNGKDTIAIRMATSKALEELIIKTGSPLFMSSANQSGKQTARNLDEIEEVCPTLEAMMEGEVSFGKGSTIVDCTNEQIKIVREGPISVEQIIEKRHNLLGLHRLRLMAISALSAEVAF